MQIDCLSTVYLAGKIDILAQYTSEILINSSFITLPVDILTGPSTSVPPTPLLSSLLPDLYARLRPMIGL